MSDLHGRPIKPVQFARLWSRSQFHISLVSKLRFLFAVAVTLVYEGARNDEPDRFSNLKQSI